MQRLGIEPKMNARTVALIFGKFLYLFLASLILGLVLGLFSALLLKKYNVSQTPQVMLLTAFCCKRKRDKATPDTAAAELEMMCRQWV